MSEIFEYTPENVCSRHYRYEIEGDMVVSLSISGGCPGNTQGISKLIKGRNIDETISLLKGIRCPGSKTGMTSCPDQIAKGLEEYKTLHK